MKQIPLLKTGLCTLAVMMLTGCRFPGKPGPHSVPQRPDEVSNFDALYAQNCQACHGVKGRGGMAVSLASPAYIAYAGSARIAQITAKGIDGSLMPAFAKDEGGLLTNRQIQLLADGIISRWADAQSLSGATPPPYESQVQGDPAAGETLYRSDCLRCHAPGPQSILGPTYLALVSKGGLRTMLVAGKPSQGMPDWRGYPGGLLSDKQLADLVAFMVGHRAAIPGQPSPKAPATSRDQAAASQPQQPPATQANPRGGDPRHNTPPVLTAPLKHLESVKP